MFQEVSDELFFLQSGRVAFELKSKYSARFPHYLGMIFITRERIALLVSKFHFQIED